MAGHISGTVRFSIESLLYYAPRVTEAGTDLESAVMAVARKLDDLGDFCGDSWPDQPFRAVYPRSQYAMLVIAAQLAYEIQGIGGGIAQMARTYGVTENENAADTARIAATQNRINSQIDRSHEQAQPPDKSIKVPIPPLPPGPHPTPRPGPAARLASPGPTPSPQPGVDSNLYRPKDPQSCLGPWPTGDPARMEEAAGYWATLHGALDRAWSELQNCATYILADSQGPAADEFGTYVDKLTNSGNGALTRAIEMAEYMQDACLQQAESITTARSRIEQIAIEYAASLAITGVIAVLTFALAAMLTAAIDAGMAARLTQIIVVLTEDGTRIAEVLDRVTQATTKLWAVMTVGGLAGGAIGGVDLVADDLIGMAFGEKPEGVTASLEAVAEDTITGMYLGQGPTNGLLGMSAKAASERLIALGETLEKGDGAASEVGKMVTTLGVRLKDGSTTVSAVNAALSQLASTGKITPAGLISGTIANRFITLIGPNTGKHAAG